MAVKSASVKDFHSHDGEETWNAEKKKRQSAKHNTERRDSLEYKVVGKKKKLTTLQADGLGRTFKGKRSNGSQKKIPGKKNPERAEKKGDGCHKQTDFKKDSGGNESR